MTSHSDQKRKSLRYSILDGSFAASMIGFGESFFMAFAVFLQANNIQLGLLSALPLLLGSLFQLASNRLISLFRTRKRLVSSMALSQGLMYIPVLLVFFLGPRKLNYLIAFVCVYWILGMILSPAWNSWMGDLVDEKERGGYFGKRNKITGSASFLSFLAAGYVLHLYSDGSDYEYLGFVTIFMIALCARIFSYVFLTMKYEPQYTAPPRAEFSFIDFIREARFRNYGRFVLYLSLMNFSVYLSVPFFVPYMLKDLQLDYMTFTIVNAAAIISKLLAMPVWGSASDRFGTKKVLGLTGFLMPIVPFLWVLSKDVYYLVLIQIYSGFIWGGFELSSFNFVFDTTTAQKRATVIAYYNVLNGVCIFTGALAGGLIVKYNNVFWSKYLFVFVLSAVMRYVASFIFIPRLREVRIVEEIPYSKLFFKIIMTMPTSGLIYSFIPFRKKK